MLNRKRPFVKICCIASIQEAHDAISFGASAIGLVGKMPSGPGPIDDALIRKIAATIPPPVASFLLTSETLADAIIQHHYQTFTNTLQLVDELSEKKYDLIKQALPAIRIVQVIHIIDEASIDEALEISQWADALLLDSGNPKLAFKELGGTGRVHNWKLSRKIVEQSNIPVFLAGGLTPSNVQQAMDIVQPYGLDVCSGVRTNGNLDLEKVEAFFQAVN